VHLEVKGLVGRIRTALQLNHQAVGGQTVFWVICQIHGPNRPVVQLEPPMIDPSRERRVECIGLWVFGEDFSEDGCTPRFVGLPSSHLALLRAVSHQAAARTRLDLVSSGVDVAIVTSAFGIGHLHPGSEGLGRHDL